MKPRRHIRMTVAAATLLGALSGLAVTMAPSAASAQAWTRDQGEGYVNFSLTSLSGDQIFNPAGELEPIDPEYSQTIVGFYSELGLVDRWLTLSLSAELFRRNELEGLAATQGFGDLQIGLWSGLVTSPLRLTVGAILGLPTGDDRPSAGGDDTVANEAARSLPTGDGEVDVTPTVILGYNYGLGGWLRQFVTARVGYWLRTRGFSDAITYQLELGTQVPVTFLDRFWLTVRLRGVESFDNPAQGGFAGLGDGITYTSLSGELYGRIWDRLGAAVSVDTAFRAKGIIGAAPLRFTLSYEF